MKIFYILMLVSLLSIQSNAQTPTYYDYTPTGGAIVLASEVQGTYINRNNFFETNGKTVDYVYFDKFDSTWYNKILFIALPGTDVLWIQQKIGVEDKCLILLNDGQVFIVSEPGGAPPKQLATVTPVNPYDQFIEILGDDLYCTVGNNLFVLRDTNGLWQIDTAGLPPSWWLLNMAIDSSQKVWLCASNEIYSQPLTDSVWTLVPGTSNTHHVFVDRFQNIWASKFSGLEVSTDGGTTFNPAPTGIPSNNPIVRVSVDIYGNVYALTATTAYSKGGNKVYLSSGGTQPFVRIDQPVASEFSNYGITDFYNDIAADSFVVIAHAAGLHTSIDTGATWTLSPGPPSVQAYSLVATADNQLMMTTPSGLHKGLPNNWAKKFPTQGYMNDVIIFKSNTGDLFAKAESNGANSSNIFRYNFYKSTDNGSTWVVDTNGMVANDVAMDEFYVDENGTQHAAGRVYVAGFGNRLAIWKKELSQNWTLDTVGLPTIFNSADAAYLGSDKQGKIFFSIRFSGTYNTYSRSISGTVWTLETGLNNIRIYDMASKPGETIIGGPGLFRKNGNNFNNLTLPAGVSAQDIISSAVTFDGKGVLWAYFELLPLPATQSTGSGIFYTDDFITWHQPINNVDTALFSKLVAIGDSVFALPLKFEGVYVFDTTTTVVGIKENISNTENIQVYPNPFSNKVTFSFELQDKKSVSLKIFSSFGQLVHQTKKQLMQPGKQKLLIDLSVPNGMFLYELNIGNEIYQGKIVKD